MEHWYRSFLLAMTVFVLVGTTVELVLTEHDESLVQLIPYGLAGIGLAAVVAVIHKATRVRVRTLQVVVVLLVLGGAFGIYEHVAHNFAFELEIRPNATAGDVVMEALQGGSPPIAPGVLALAAVLAGAAVYRHPALRDVDHKG